LIGNPSTQQVIREHQQTRDVLGSNHCSANNLLQCRDRRESNSAEVFTAENHCKTTAFIAANYCRTTVIYCGESLQNDSDLLQQNSDLLQ
jgi:hypothetical protein